MTIGSHLTWPFWATGDSPTTTFGLMETNTLWGLGSRCTRPTGLYAADFTCHPLPRQQPLMAVLASNSTLRLAFKTRSFVRCFMVLSTWSTRLVKFLFAYLLKVVLLGELGNIWQLETTNPLILNSKWHIWMLIWPEWRPFWSHQKDSAAIEAVMRKATRRP